MMSCLMVHIWPIESRLELAEMRPRTLIIPVPVFEIINKLLLLNTNLNGAKRPTWSECVPKLMVCDEVV
jgi:hypothetical protein